MSERENFQLLGVTGMAKILGVPPSRLYRETMRRGEGTIPRIKIGKYVRFDPTAVIDYLKKQTQAAQAA